MTLWFLPATVQYFVIIFFEWKIIWWVYLFTSPLSCKSSLQFSIIISVWVFYFITFFFASFLSAFFLLCCFVPLVLFSHCVYVHPCGGTRVWFATPCPLHGYTKRSGEPVVPRDPQLSALSLRSSSCFSPAFPRCRPNPLAANGKPVRHSHFSERQLRHRRWGGWLRKPVPHSSVLPIHRVALQQVRPRPPPWGGPGPVTISGQYPEGPKVRKTSHFYLESALDCWWSPLSCSLSTFTELTEGQIHQIDQNYARKYK